MVRQGNRQSSGEESDSEAIKKIVKRWSRENKSDIENRIAENECE